MAKRSLSFCRDTNGTALAEAAIVLPLLVLILGAAAELGRFMYYYNTLDKATRASARYICAKELDGSKTPPANLNAAKNLAIYGNTAGTGVKILPDTNLTTSNVSISPASGTPSTVTVSITGYSFVPIFAVGPMSSLAISITPSTTMRYLLTTPLE